MRTPLLIISYNRPALTKQLVTFLNTLHLPEVYVFCDGPKDDQDAQKVEAVRRILDDLKQPFKKNFQQKNLGCQSGVETALDWIFKTNSQAIILEDDLLVDPSFFEYAEELLNRYQDDDRIMMISANNFHEQPALPYSYFFSEQSTAWGWATWKRAWLKYHKTKALSDELLKTPELLKSNPKILEHYVHFRQCCDKEIDSWGYIWLFTLFAHHGLCIYPKVNLAVNNGFGADATHTKYFSDHAYLKKGALTFPLQHPPLLFSNDRYVTFVKKSHSTRSLIFQIAKHFLRSHF